MSKPVWFQDLDGCLCDYDTAMREYQKSLASPDEVDFTTENWKKYDERLPWIQARGDLIRSKPEFWRNLAPIHDNFIIMRLAENIGYDIHILTKGPQSKGFAWSEKLNWVRKHVGSSDKYPVSIVASKAIVVGSVLFDDWPEYCEGWLKTNPRGNVIMPTAPYNEHYVRDRVTHWTGNNHHQIEALLRDWYAAEQANEV